MNDSMTFGSLFAGIGGFDLGFERAGMVCRWQVEIDEYANRVLRKHWPSVRRWRDVCTWPQQDTERVDVICGGFPCQDISYAGRGPGLEGERSGLFFESVRVVCELRPRAIVLENVAALFTRGLDRILGTLAEIGYDAEWHSIPAAAFGAPHIRDRVFILAYTSSGRRQRSYKPDCSVESAGADWRLQPAGSGSGSSGRWATEPNVGRVAHGVPRRVDRLRGLGNAVVPQVAEYVGRMVLGELEE